MSNNPKWKSNLQHLINRYAAADGKGGRIGPIAVALFLIFGQLRRLGFQMDPINIGGRHVMYLVRYWTCDARIGQWCRDRRVEMLAQPYDARYIASLLADLRRFCDWLGKPGLVLPAHRYLAGETDAISQSEE